MIDYHELQFLDEHTQVSVEEVLAASGMTLEDLQALADWGVFGLSAEQIDRVTIGELRVSSASLHVARRAMRLRHAFDLDTTGIAVALSLLERIDDLERELRELRGAA